MLIFLNFIINSYVIRDICLLGVFQLDCVITDLFISLEGEKKAGSAASTRTWYTVFAHSLTALNL